MSELFTAKNFNINKAPAKIELLGDKTRRPEPAQHIIEFPGGAVEVSRTTDGNYWAHILINRQFMGNDFDGMHHRFGEVIDSRITADGDVIEILDYPKITQIAVLIKPCERRIE